MVYLLHLCYDEQSELPEAYMTFWKLVLLSSVTSDIIKQAMYINRKIFVIIMDLIQKGFKVVEWIKFVYSRLH